MRALADEVRAELPAALVPDTSADVLLLLYALLAAVEGDRVEPQHVHDAWTVWKSILGQDHAATVPFEQLSPQVRALDDPYVEAIRRVARRHVRGA
jgi:hypothetical protein